MNKKAQKKKDREKKARKKVLLRRAALRAPKEEENKLKRKMNRIAKIKKDMGKLNFWSDEVFLRMSEDKLRQLEKNSKILKALEEEHKKSHENKRDINKKLEEEGYLTLEQKLNHLYQNLVSEQNLTESEEVSGGIEPIETNLK